MPWLARFIIFSVIPFVILLMLADANHWSDGVVWAVCIGNLLGFIEGIVSERS